MYGAETWALRKVQERKLGVAEMGMLRRMYGVIKLDRISNERVLKRDNGNNNFLFI